MSEEKMYLVRREVMAKNIQEAIRKKDGNIYSVELALDQPEDKLKCGFDKDKKENSSHK
jgi:hypothetical protein